MHVPKLVGKSLGFLLLLAVIVSVTFDCFVREKWIVEEGSVPVSFEALPGAIGVWFSAWSNNEWHYKRLLYRDGKVFWTGKLPVPGQNAVAGGAEARAPWMPSLPGVANDGPYMRSPDGKLLAAGAGTQHEMSSRLLIFDLGTNEIRTRVHSEEGWGIGSVAWSPDGRYVAVIKAKPEFNLCLFEILTYLTGYPSGRLTVVLEIFDIAGNRIAKTLLLSDSPDWRAEVVWTE